MFSRSVYCIGWICQPVVKVVWFWGCFEQWDSGFGYGCILECWSPVFQACHFCFVWVFSMFQLEMESWEWRSYVEHNNSLFNVCLYGNFSASAIVALWRKFVYDPLVVGVAAAGDIIWRLRVEALHTESHSFIWFFFHVCMCCRLHWWSANTRCEGCVWFRVEFLALAMSMSSDHHPHCMPSTPEDVPGGAKTITSKVLDTSAGLVQSLKPIKNFQQVSYDASSSYLKRLSFYIWQAYAFSLLVPLPPLCYLSWELIESQYPNYWCTTLQFHVNGTRQPNYWCPTMQYELHGTRQSIC